MNTREVWLIEYELEENSCKCGKEETRMLLKTCLVVLINVLLWLLVILVVIPSLVIITPILIAKKIEQIIYERKYQVHVLPSADVLFTFANPTNEPYIHAVITINCEVTTTAFAEKMEKIIDSNNESNLNYKFKSYITDGCLNQYWMSETDFNITDHAITYTQKNITSKTELFQITGELFSRTLDFRNKSPWYVYIVPFVEDNEIKTALLVKLSHAFGDGVSLAYFLMEQFSDNVAGNTPAKKFSQLHFSQLFLKGLFYLPVSYAKMLLKRKDVNNFMRNELTGNKEVQWSRHINLPDIKKVKNRLACSVNDVLCASLSTTLEKFIENDKGKRQSQVTTLFPVDIRSSFNEGIYLSNNFATILIDLLTGTSDIMQNIKHMKKTFDYVKQSGIPFSINLGWRTISHILPKPMTKFFIYDTVRKTTAVTSNIIGPYKPINMLNGIVEGVTFWAPSTHRQTLSFSFCSYNECVCFSVMKDSVLDLNLQKLVHTFEETIARLVQQLEREPMEVKVDQRIVV